MEQIIQNCKKCPSYTSRPDKIGHQNCPIHRPCSGNDEWEPVNCDSCTSFRDNLGSLSPQSHKQSLHSLKNVLKKMRDSIKRPWHYHEMFTRFIGDNLEPSSSSLRSISIRTDTDLDQSIHDQDEFLEQEQTAHDNAPAMENNTTFQAGTSYAPTMENHSLHTVSQPGMLYPQPGTSYAQPGMSYTQPGVSYAPTMESTAHTIPQPGTSFSYQQLAEAFRPMFQNLSMQIAAANSRSGTPRSGRSNTPDIERSPLAENNEAQESSDSEERPPFFVEFGHFWFYTTYKNKIEGHKIWLNNELKPFIRHPSKQDAVRTLEESTESCPYMSAYQAFQTLISRFGADKVTADKLGPKNRSFRLHLEENSGLAKAMQILHTCSSSALQNLHSGDKQNFTSAFTTSVFEAVSAVHFISGWNFSDDSDYLKFAKDDTIDLKKTTCSLEIYLYTIHIHPKLLQAERSTRRCLIECISGLAMLDRNIAETKDPSQASSLSATARQFLSILKDITGRWIEAKYEVRHMALQFSKSPAADKLMLSDVWHAELFAPSEVKAFINNDTLQKGTMARLNLSKERNEKIKKQNIQCPCSSKIFREHSRSPIKQPFHSQQQLRSQQPFHSQQGYNRNEAHTHRSTQFQTQNKGKTQPYSKPQQKTGKKFFTPKNNYTKTNPSSGFRGSKQAQS